MKPTGGIRTLLDIARRGKQGFTLIWSLVVVVLLATLVSAMLIWSRYVLREGGITQMQEANPIYKSDNTVAQMFSNNVIPIINKEFNNFSISGNISQVAPVVESVVQTSLAVQGINVKFISYYPTTVSPNTSAPNMNVIFRMQNGSSKVTFDVILQGSVKTFWPFQSTYVWTYAQTNIM